MPDPFKAYDIRGLYPDQLDEDLAYHIGNAIAQVLDLKRQALCRWPRHAGFGAVFETGADQGPDGCRGNCRRLRHVKHPGLSFAMHHLDTAGGAQVTASHNPAPYGGVKITAPGFKPVAAGTGMEEIEKIARAKQVVTAEGGAMEEALTLDAYAEFLAPWLDLGRPLKVVIDGGNGIIGTMFQHLAPKLPGLEIIPMYFDPDGRFPFHDANPLKPENLPDLQAKVLEPEPTLAPPLTAMATAAP